MILGATALVFVISPDSACDESSVAAARGGASLLSSWVGITEAPHTPSERDEMRELLQIAVHATSMASVREVLRAIAKKTGSDGCILWRVSPIEGSKDLFVADDWFEGDRRDINHSLPLNGSITGKAIARQQQICSTLRAPDRDRFLADAGVSSFCSTPIIFADGVDGAVNLYRRAETSKDWKDADEYAGAVPLLLGVIEDAVSLRLLKSLDPFLDSIAGSLPTRFSLFEHIKVAMTQVCEQIAEALNCAEVSIFLEDAFDASHQYRLAGTSSPSLAAKSTYEASEDDGLTGWSLARPETKVIVFDFGDRTSLPAKVRRQHVRGRISEDRPLSFMAVPILDGAAVVGLIRCSLGRGPVYFDERQYQMLRQVGSRIAPVWTALARNRSLQSIVSSLRALNGIAHAELTKQAPDESRILDEALRILAQVVPGAETSDVRLLSNDGRALRFAALLGDAWTEGTAEEQERRRARTFPLDTDGPRSAGARVVQTGETHVVTDPASDPLYDETFASTQRLIVTPLSLGSDVYGVLDVRSSGARDFPDFVVPMLELLGSQLALYQQLAMVVRELSNRVAEQVQIHEDISHQLRSPIATAQGRLTAILRRMPEPDELKRQLASVRALCRRAMQVTYESGLVAQLARGKSISVTPTPIPSDELLRLIRETAQDASYLATGRTQSRVQINTKSFENVGTIRADRLLLEQALAQVLDNAFKYSFASSTITVDARHTTKGSVAISITNEGVAIRPDEVPRLFDRGWQSEEARAMSDRGSGIGLWIAANIMRAHGGEIRITPTDRNRRTTVTLLLRGGT